MGNTIFFNGVCLVYFETCLQQFAEIFGSFKKTIKVQILFFILFRFRKSFERFALLNYELFNIYSVLATAYALLFVSRAI